jgi:hypothetical protein
MQRKFFNIILFFVVGVIGIPNLSQAQEGGGIEEKSETIQQDSLQILSESPEDGSQENSDMLPVGPMPDFNLSKVPVVDSNFDKEEKKNSNGVNEKIKAEEPQSNHSFNFIYYLFYKFKLADSIGD